MVIEINQFDKIIFLNSDSGDASFNKSDLKTNFFNVNKNDYLNNFKINTYDLCLSFFDKCNLNCLKEIIKYKDIKFKKFIKTNCNLKFQDAKNLHYQVMKKEVI